MAKALISKLIDIESLLRCLVSVDHRSLYSYRQRSLSVKHCVEQKNNGIAESISDILAEG